MIHEPATLRDEPETRSAQHIVHVLLQFALAVRQRLQVLLTAVACCALLGGLYFATATRYYSAKAELLVLQSGEATASAAMTAQGSGQDSLMPTYENVINSAKVLEGALALLSPEDRRIDMPSQDRSKWIAVLQRNLTVRAVNRTNIISIEYRSKDPGTAVRVVNAVVQSYLDFMDRTHRGTASEIVRVLSVEKEDLSQRMAEKEQELQATREQIGHLDIGIDNKTLHPLVQRAIAFNDSLLEVQKERVGLEASLAAAENAVRNGQDLQQYVLGMSDTVGRELLLAGLGFNTQDATSQAMAERQLIADQALLQSLGEQLGPNHPRVAALVYRIRITQQYLAGYQDRIRQRLAQMRDTDLGPMLLAMMQQRLNETRQRELSLQAQYEQARIDASQLTGQLAQIEILENDLAGLRDLHSALVRRVTGIDLTNDLRTQIITEPSENSTPVSPDLVKVALMALIAGLGLGLLCVYVLDILDDRFRSVDEIQTQLLAPVLAVVRQLKPKESAGLASLQIYAEPDAAESESFRTLRTALSLTEKPSQRIVISSAEPGDGKSTVLANLAVAFAQSEKRTLLVDADLRRPGLTAMLGFRRAGGLSAILRSAAPVAEMAAAHIQATGVEGLDLLPAGVRPTNPAELLSGPRLAELLAWAENVYDQILIDSPPALAASDTAVIGRLVDGVVLVVQPDKNRRRLVLRAAESFAVVKIHLAGVVLNRIGAERNGGYYGYNSGYGYDYGYASHGEASSGRAAEEAPPEGIAGAVPGAEEDGPIAGVVPRRVA